MAATRDEVDIWIAHAKSIGASHIISVCDTFDYTDYPVYVMPHEKLSKVREMYTDSMQKINEIINISLAG